MRCSFDAICGMSLEQTVVCRSLDTSILQVEPPPPTVRVTPPSRRDVTQVLPPLVCHPPEMSPVPVLPPVTRQRMVWPPGSAGASVVGGEDTTQVDK